MCKYRVRYFYSKGAFLVLVWTLLVTIASLSMERNVRNYTDLCDYKIKPVQFQILPKWMLVIPALIGLLGAVLSGWLADAKLGNYRVMKYSIILMFITSICLSIVTLLPCSVYNVYTVAVIFCLGESVLITAFVAFVVTALQLGLDQMPDASSSNITSFIAWLVFVLFMSKWISDTLFKGIWFCLRNDTEQFPTFSIQLWSLIPVSCMSVTIVTDYLFAKKWLIIEPNCPQSLKTIYQVLKFAWKHKSPLNRSTLTYWEEDIPSRMDLGKLRYGGPFTTEEVEDVKTFFKILIIYFPMFLISCSFYPTPVVFEFDGFVTECIGAQSNVLVF